VNPKKHTEKGKIRTGDPNQKSGWKGRRKGGTSFREGKDERELKKAQI